MCVFRNKNSSIKIRLSFIRLLFNNRLRCLLIVLVCVWINLMFVFCGKVVCRLFVIFCIWVWMVIVLFFLD